MEMIRTVFAYSAMTLVFWGAANAYGEAETQPLTLFTWEDYLDEQVIEEWEAQTGIPIHLVLFDDEAQRNLVLAGHNASNIDVVMMDSATIGVMARAGHLYPVKAQIDRQMFWPDACGEYGRHYLWGGYGIVYRKDKIATPITSWNDLLYPDEALSGHIGMLGHSDDLLAPVLAALNYSIDTNLDAELKEAFELLKAQSSHVKTYDYIYTYVSTHPEQQDVWIAPAFSGDQFSLNTLQKGDYWEYVTPEEGAIIWVDCLAIPSQSARKEEAQAFIDFLSRKDISARNATSLKVASAYKDAMPLIEQDILQDKSIYLDLNDLQRIVTFKELKGIDILRRTRIKDALIRYHDTH